MPGTVEDYPDNLTVPHPANAYGFPIPGPQSPSATSVMAKDYFVSNTTWESILAHGSFDYIVIGSGCTAYAFIDEALRDSKGGSPLPPEKQKRILCLERGDFWLPTHFQNLPPPFKTLLGGPSETYPWTLSAQTFSTPELQYCHGSAPFFGGRSTFWSGWSPQPTPSLLRDFPAEMIATTSTSTDFWGRAKTLLNVTSAADIDDGVFSELQNEIGRRLELPVREVPSASISEPAQLAVAGRSPTSTLRFNKFSVPGPLLELVETQKRRAEEVGVAAPLQLVVNCPVLGLRLDQEDGMVRAIETAKGTLRWSDDKTKVILCAGAFPNATLLLNSIPDAAETVGKRVTGHFLTHIAARIPIRYFGDWTAGQPKHLEIAAHYLAGEHPETKRQYHVQITAIHSPNPELDAEDAARECPDLAAAATHEQLKGSEDHVVFVCATLGEFTETNTENWFKLDPQNQDPTCNVKLQYTLHPDDRKLWDLMDEATYQTIEAVAGPNNSNNSNNSNNNNSVQQHIQYWHAKPENPNPNLNENQTQNQNYGWKYARPPVSEIRVPGVVHETSTAFVGRKEEGGSLDGLYRPHGVRNVHVTGGAIFPTAGSWNPTLTMCGFAQDLARRLNAGEGNPEN